MENKKELKDLQPGDLVHWYEHGDRVPVVAPILNVTKTRIRVQRTGHSFVYEFDRETGRLRGADWRRRFSIQPVQPGQAEAFTMLSKHRDAWTALDYMTTTVLAIKRVRGRRYNNTPTELLNAAIAALDAVLKATEPVEKQA